MAIREEILFLCGEPKWFNGEIVWSIGEMWGGGIDEGVTIG